MKTFWILTLTMLLGLATACSGSEESQPGTDSAEQAAADQPAAMQEGSGDADTDSAGQTGGESGDPVQAAIDNPSRSAAAKARDASRKPGEILRFYGIEPGMTVVEIGAGGGYYTEILSYVVGPEGTVIAQNTPGDFYEQFIKDRFEPLAARLDNVEPFLGPPVQIPAEAGSVDAVLITLIYHHMHFTEESGESLPERTKQTLQAVYDILKPGGVLAVIEHAAPDGTGRAESAALHRVDEQTTIDDITAQGFELAETSDLLHVESDDRSIYWRGTEHEGNTWRLVHKYVKPAPHESDETP